MLYIYVLYIYLWPINKNQHLDQPHRLKLVFRLNGKVEEVSIFKIQGDGLKCGEAETSDNILVTSIISTDDAGNTDSRLCQSLYRGFGWEGKTTCLYECTCGYGEFDDH